MVVIGISEDTGKQERKGIGMEFLIYLVRVVVQVHPCVWLKSKLVFWLSACSAIIYFFFPSHFVSMMMIITPERMNLDGCLKLQMSLFGLQFAV